jgi:hypothetical protein
MANYKGVHLWVKKFGYTHHGLGIGKGEVIHYSGLAHGLEAGPICKVSLEEFSSGSKIYMKKHPERKFNVSESLLRAKSRLGEDAYTVWGNNCEHFVNWCINDKHNSRQVDKVVTSGSGAASLAAARGGIAVVSATGATAGLSGSGVMSGLATIGGTVGGGAVAGAAGLAASSGLGAASILNNTVLKDDPALTEKERNSRSVGRGASYAGAGVGTAGGVAAISAMGATGGLSAAGITSGLAAVGGTVGGGMAAGVGVVVAAPAVLAVALGFGIYKLLN